MTINYNVTGERRKALAQAVSDILGEPLRYCGMPTANYECGGFVITKTGELIGEGNIRDTENLNLWTELHRRGFICMEEAAILDTLSTGMTEREELGLGRERRDPIGENGMQASDVPIPDNELKRLTVDMPMNSLSLAAIANIRKIVASKETLIKKALGADSLPVEVAEDKLRFPWFNLTGADGEVDAYLRFITAICEMAKRQRRVTAKARNVENDKFTMRLFLIRLGFIGPEYKTARKILLSNLAGNTAWKSGRRPERTEAEEKGVVEP